MLSSAISNKIVSNKVLFILIGAAAAIFLTIYMFTTSTFNISRIVPGLTYASAFNGLKRVREVWRTTKCQESYEGSFWMDCYQLRYFCFG
ncbi:hypothetical protein P7H25_16940 [Paenibacillus larvae]|nr:hypothetical protein [Paenibacillus larvae]MDT2256940.1 hypothetical protein [Paenibacillus larvae]